ncbi:glycoside hydrolase family 3 protein [Kutzneria albida]|uniref:beta-N-acetylhexosaminidase n=1 Tax=Kutzneria albida DSM 43870 TaxID=1449976 RepID=W5VXV9_9PSEU|nr:beta-N-acetylglucosaminidase (putative secreted protein) [Kutzneria albida DSM 43870]
MRQLRRPLIALTTALATVATTAVTANAQTGTENGYVTQAVVNSVLHRMSLPEKVGQLFMTYGYGPAANTVDPRNQTEFGVDTPAQVVQRYHLGGFIYFAWSDNIANPGQIAKLSNGLQQAALTSGAHVPLLISTDQEQGLVTRIGAPATTLPGSMALGASRDTGAARQAAAITGRELRAMGVNMDNAPDSDVNVNPANPIIGIRSFGSDPELVSDMVSAQVHGYQDSGPAFRTVSATAKHFPGHGDAATDSHTGLPVIDHDKATWEQVDAPPFRAAIASGVDVIMTAHIVFPKLDTSGDPSTLSPTVLTGMLRNELGYQGMVITDSLQMAGVRQKYSDAEIPVKALQAGADMLLMPQHVGTAIEGVLNAVRTGELSEQRIDQSVRRILTVKYRRGVLFQPFTDISAVDRVVGSKDNKAAAQRITDNTVTVLRNDDKLLPLKSKPKSVLVTGWGQTATATLANAVTARGSKATALTVGAAPTPAAISAAVQAAGANDAVVVLTNGAYKDPGQQDLVRQLVATGKPVIAVCVGNPYDPGSVPQARTWIDTYSSTAVSMESLTKVIFGEHGPRGLLPVSIPGPDGYAYGAGLTW